MAVTVITSEHLNPESDPGKVQNVQLRSTSIIACLFDDWLNNLWSHVDLEL